LLLPWAQRTKFAPGFAVENKIFKAGRESKVSHSIVYYASHTTMMKTGVHASVQKK